MSVEIPGELTGKEPAKQKTDRIIKMTDGREVNFNSRNKLIKDSSRNPEVVRDEVYQEDGKLVAPLRINVVTGEFFTADVEVPVIEGNIVVSLDDAVFLLRLARHGKSQKISDAVTKPETDEDLVAGVERAINQLNAKIWNQLSQDSCAGQGDLIEACRRVKNIPKFLEDGTTMSPEFVEWRKKLLARDVEVLKQLRTNGEIAQHIAQIQAERATEKANRLSGKKPEVSALDALAALEETSDE